jgi:hypothetical protein
VLLMIVDDLLDHGQGDSGMNPGSLMMQQQQQAAPQSMQQVAAAAAQAMQQQHAQHQQQQLGQQLVQLGPGLGPEMRAVAAQLAASAHMSLMASSLQMQVKGGIESKLCSNSEWGEEGQNGVLSVCQVGEGW